MLLDAMMMEPRKGLMERDQLPAGMRVLAVDDDPVCLKVLEVLLRRCLYHGQCLLALHSLLSFKYCYTILIFLIICCTSIARLTRACQGDPPYSPPKCASSNIVSTMNCANVNLLDRNAGWQCKILAYRIS